MGMIPFKTEDEEELDQMSFPPQEIQASLLDQLQAARGFTKEKETGLRSDIEKAAPGSAATFLASLGAGLAGNNQAQAMGAINQKQDSAKERLNEYLASKRNVLSEASSERQLIKSDTERMRDMSENDSSSEESKAARDSLKAIVPSGNIPDSMTAAQVKKVFPSYEKAAELKARNQDRMASREERRSLSDANRQDRMDRELEKRDIKSDALQTPFGPARTPQDAKELKSASESKSKFDRTMNELIDLRKTYGAEVTNREAVARGRQLSKDLLLMYKDLAKLGVLSQADEKILNAIIPPDPLAFDSSQVVGQDAILNNLESFKRDKAAEFQDKLATRLKEAPIAASPQSGSTSFPRQVRNANGEVATVGSEEELKEATSEGFR